MKYSNPFNSQLEELSIQQNLINYNKQDAEGNTFLISAAQAGSKDIVSFLI
jgi:ankyrin repeat protein